MNDNSKVSVPPKKVPMNPTTQAPVKTGGVGTTGAGSIKGFGMGSSHGSAINAERGIVDSDAQTRIDGFSTGGSLPGKV